MVKSKIKKRIVYEEDNNLDELDLEYESTIYEINIIKLRKRVNIILGKEKKDYETDGVIFFYVYLIGEEMDVIRSIGIFELEKKDYDYFKENEDIESVGNILWYTNLSEKDISSKIEYDSEQSEDEVTEVEALKYGKKIQNFKNIKLISETKELANNIRKNFVSNISIHSWIQEFMKNSNYDIVDNEGNGDCFFCVIRDALKYAGIDISVSKMRDMLSSKVDEDLYYNYKEQYDMYSTTLESEKKRLRALNKTYRMLEKDAKSAFDSEVKKEKMSEMDKKLKETKKIKEELKFTEELLQDFIYMADISNVEEFKKYIKSNNFWADTWVISTIEILLNIKCILLSSDAYDQDDKDNVVHCNQLTDRMLIEKGEFNPDYYIITDYNGYHYQLIRYGRKGIFTFNELPYDLKNLIVYKCLEGDNGPYNIIPEFSKLKNDIHNGGKKETNKIDLDNIYKSKTKFQIYYKSSDKLPGKGVGEVIDDGEINKYSALKKIKDWRRKLSNMWTCEIEIDGYTFQTVEHYLQANKFINHKDLYKLFTLESKSDLSKNVLKAKSMGIENSTIRDKKYTIDPSYETKRDELLEKALNKKFVENKEYKELLMKTHDAKLLEYKRAMRPRVMDELMKLRKKLK